MPKTFSFWQTNILSDEDVSLNSLPNLKKAILSHSSKEAACLLADMILANGANMRLDEQLRFLEIAADFDHAEACFKAGCITANLMMDSIPHALINIPKSLSFLSRAAMLNHKKATYALIRALMDKDPPNIVVNNKEFQSICENLIDAGDGMIALYYGRALCHYEPEEFESRIQLSQNIELGLQYLLKALSSKDAKIKRQALSTLKRGLEDEVWPSLYAKEFRTVFGDEKLIQNRVGIH